MTLRTCVKDKPGGYWIWIGIAFIAVGIFLLVFANVGCGVVNAVPPDAAVPDAADDDAPAPFIEEEGDRPGSLPPGYYQRQCQWDACGGPKDQRPAIDPVRDRNQKEQP